MRDQGRDPGTGRRERRGKQVFARGRERGYGDLCEYISYNVIARLAKEAGYCSRHSDGYLPEGAVLCIRSDVARIQDENEKCAPQKTSEIFKMFMLLLLFNTHSFFTRYSTYFLHSRSLQFPQWLL